MRARVCLLAVVMHACSSSKHEDSGAAAEPESAVRLEQDLAPTFLDLTIAGSVATSDLGFPVLKAQAKCGEDILKASYDPYRDVLRVAFQKEPSLTVEARSLRFNRAVVWKAEHAFKGDQMLFTVTNPDGTKANTDSASWTWVEDISTKHKTLFPADTDVQIDVEGTAMVAKPTSSTDFTWVKATFPGWRLNLHVFSRASAEKMASHKKVAERADALLKALAARASDVDKLRKSKHPRAIAVVKRYDELVAGATKDQGETKTMPSAQYKDSLSIEKVPACAN
jgi:hypothetical protein